MGRPGIIETNTDKLAGNMPPPAITFGPDPVLPTARGVRAVAEALTQIKGSPMEHQDVERLLSSLDSRFVSWRAMLLIIIPAFSVLVGVVLFLVAQHDARPVHTEAVTQREIDLREQLNRDQWEAVTKRLDNIDTQLKNLQPASE